MVLNWHLWMQSGCMILDFHYFRTQGHVSAYDRPPVSIV